MSLLISSERGFYCLGSINSHLAPGRNGPMGGENSNHWLELDSTPEQERGLGNTAKADLQQEFGEVIPKYT